MLDVNASLLCIEAAAAAWRWATAERGGPVADEMNADTNVWRETEIEKTDRRADLINNGRSKFSEEILFAYMVNRLRRQFWLDKTMEHVVSDP